VKYFPLVWAALWRKPAEGILTFLAITAAFTLLSVMIGVNVAVRQIINHAPMDRLWVSRRFQPVSPPFGMPYSVGEQIANIHGVIAVARSRGLGGYHVDPHNSAGINFVDEGMRTVWSEGPIGPQQWDSLFATPSGIFISKKAAEKWRLKKDDIFTLITSSKAQAREDGSNSWAFQVLGVVADDWDRSGTDGFMIGNMKYLENSEPLENRGQGYSYEVAVKDADQAINISSRIDRLFANSGTATLSYPKRINEQSYVNRGVSTAALTAAIAAAGLGMILVVTGNAIARSVRERASEFAVLQTLGFHHFHLVILVFVEAAIPCILGAAVSAACAGLLEQWSFRFLPQVLVTFVTMPMPRLLVLTWTFGIAILLALTSSAIPIMKLRRLSVTDVLAGR
jgi:putative ABC transport system permease protein